MRSEAVTYCPLRGWHDARGEKAPAPSFPADLVMVFGAREILAAPGFAARIAERYPSARLAGCSTGGQFIRGDVTDATVSVLALHLEHSTLRLVEMPIVNPGQSDAVGEALGAALAADDLKAVFVLSDGIRVNGSRLVAGLRASLGDAISITGGLAGDGANFAQTLVLLDGAAAADRVLGIGFYGAAFRVGHGCRDGWSPFGPRRLISKAEANVLFELDGNPALELYKRYLGEEAAGLPATGLLYPMMLTDPANSAHRVIRTVLAVDEAHQSLTFAGDMPVGWHAQLMRGDFDRLSQAAGEAAASALLATPGESAAILVSCIGRRLVMGENTIDEISAAKAALGENVAIAGFYSYGEISPHAESGCCELHNQTMTVTTFSEAA